MGMPKELSDAERDVIVESLRWRSDDLIRLLKDFVYASKEYMVQGASARCMLQGA